MTQLTPVSLSIQPATYHALTFYIAEELGYFKELGLDVTFKTYPSGAPQVADAVDNKAWDVGAAGVVPNILGWSKTPVIETIGISNDESATNALAANAQGVVEWSALVAAGGLGETKVLITPNSTGQFAAEECLMHFGIDYNAGTNFIYTGQPTVIAGMTEVGLADYGSLWAPNTYSLVENDKGAEIVCNGTTAGAHVPGGLMMRKEFGEEHPDLVKKVSCCLL